MILTGGRAILGLAGVFVFFTIGGYLITQASDDLAVGLSRQRALPSFPGCWAAFLPVFVIRPAGDDIAARQIPGAAQTFSLLQCGARHR